MFNDDNFLLENKKAHQLYEAVKDLPIFDYHCHLSPQEIYENRAFYDLTELWLECDHYKWRVMRNAGVPEKYITGNSAEPYEKFLAFARSLPLFPGNPVYHWAHLELKKYFGIYEPLSASTAPSIWEKTKQIMKDGSFCARNLIEKSNVDTIFTTDDPTSDLKYHKLLLQEKLTSSSTHKAPTFTVAPSFRPDKAINIEKEDFVSYLKELEKASGVIISDLSSLIKALEKRLKFFIENGCVIADISFKDFCLPSILQSAQTSLSAQAKYDNTNYDKIMINADKALKLTLNYDKNHDNNVADNANYDNLSYLMSDYKYCILKELALLFKKYDITMQIHTGVLRNVNFFRFAQCGPDCGIDSVGNALNIEAAGVLFDDIESSGFERGFDGGLPRTIIYTLNPNSYYPLATMIGDFAGSMSQKYDTTEKYDNFSGRMQLGAAWWFMDHRDGIKEQLKIFANTSGLGLFNGMLTDSRSFVSYARHDYFRRVLCSVIGEWIENGEYPDDENAIELVKNISFYNAKKNFDKKNFCESKDSKIFDAKNGGKK